VQCSECVCAGVPSAQLKSKFCFVCVKRLNVSVLIRRPLCLQSSPCCSNRNTRTQAVIKLSLELILKLQE
jgi:hypothetical protein